LGLGVAYKKQHLRPNLAGIWAKEHPKKPLLISATIEASNCKFDAQTLLQKQCLGPKLMEVWARGTSKKFGTSTYFSSR